MCSKYFPLIDRVTTRNELSDLIGSFVGELAALHASVHGGDEKTETNKIMVASLGVMFSREKKANGFKIEYIYKVDQDYPDEKSSLDDPYLDVNIGDIITKVNGKDALFAIDIGALLRNQVGKQVRISLLSNDVPRDIIVKPIASDYKVRYRDWEYGNRLDVTKKSNHQIGYLHLQAMESEDISQFYREFYPAFNSPGLIVDVRYNKGGNINSFILEKLQRKPRCIGNLASKSLIGICNMLLEAILSYL